MIIKLVMLLVMIESGGDSKAVGDGGRAVGALQIHPIMVRECNRLTGSQRWTLDDRLDVTESIRMCTLFLSYQQARYRQRYGHEPDMVTLGCSWNTGNIFRKNPERYAKKLKRSLAASGLRR